MWAPLTFLLGVITGTGSAITAKVLYGLESTGENGELKYFEKPLFLTWLMFIAMLVALPVHAIKEKYNKWGEDRTIMLKNDSKATTWRQLVLMLVPTVFDLAATALASAGLLYTTVSVYQLVRSSVMIVTALLKVTVLRQTLTRYMWIGIGINTVGLSKFRGQVEQFPGDGSFSYSSIILSVCIAMVLVSSISWIPDHMEQQPGITKDPRIGIFFILLSCIVQGSQYVFEEKLMSDDSVPPLLVVGMEGAWGSLLMPLVVLPWAAILPGEDAGGCMENVRDSWIMITNSTTIQIILVIYFICVFFFNIFAIYVTYLLNSVWHAILENFRPGAIWMVDLLLYYQFTQGTFGEAWTKWSWLELVGMMVMIAGTAVYNGSIHVPGCDYETLPKKYPHKIWIGESVTPLTASPLIQRGVRHEHRLDALLYPDLPGFGHIDSELDDSTSPIDDEHRSLLDGSLKPPSYSIQIDQPQDGPRQSTTSQSSTTSASDGPKGKVRTEVSNISKKEKEAEERRQQEALKGSQKKAGRGGGGGGPGNRGTGAGRPQQQSSPSTNKDFDHVMSNKPGSRRGSVESNGSESGQSRGGSRSNSGKKNTK